MNRGYTNVISLSGGKDSTFVLLDMLERGEPVDAVVFFDTGWEFPEMYDHLQRLEAFTGCRITRLEPLQPFEYVMLQRPVFRRSGGLYQCGKGWPSAARRWCTRLKAEALDRYVASLRHVQGAGKVNLCIGFAHEECHRAESPEMIRKRRKGVGTYFPMIEHGVTEKDALRYCKARGFDWGGLYDIFNRVSCYCCPLQPLDSLRALRRHFPHLWRQMLEWEEVMREQQHKIVRLKHEASVHELEARFDFEEVLGCV